MAYVTDTLIQNTAETDAAFQIRVNTFISDQAYYYGQVGGAYPPAPLESKSFVGFPPTSPSSDITYWDVTVSQMKRIVTFSYENTYYYLFLGVVPPLPGPPPAPTSGNIAIWGPGGTLNDGVIAVDTLVPNFTNLSPATVAGQAVEYSQLTTALSGYVPVTRNITINGVTQDLSADRTWTISGGIPSGSATQVSAGVYTSTILGVTSYSAGDSYVIKFDSSNDGASTININSIGAVNIYKNTTTPLSSGDIKTNQEITIVYDGTNFQAIGLESTQILAYVHNAEGSPITKGQVVYAYQATGNKMSVKLARADADATSAKTIGMVYDSSIGTGSDGYIIIQGVIEGINTAAFSAGDTLYLSGTTYGGKTNVKPYAPTHLVYVGIVERANAGNGQIYVRCQNGYELDEIHDVDLVSTPPSNNDVLTYVTGVNNLWKPKSISSILGYTPGTVSSVGFSAGAGISLSGTNPITGSGTVTITNSDPDQVVSLTAGTGIGITGTYPNFTITNSSPSSGGTVTSVGVDLPTTEFTITSSPVTTSGTILATWKTQSANTVFAGPTSGGAATPSFRSLVATDIPDISATYLTVSNAALNYQPLDSDLTTIAGLTPANDDIIQRKAGAWTNRTIAQYYADLQPSVKDDVYFTVPFLPAVLSPADATTYYIGAGSIAPSTTATNQDMSLPFDFTVISAVIMASGNTAAGTTENSTMSIRNTTTSTSSTMGTFQTNGSTTVIISTTINGLSINVNANDLFCLQWLAPTWATNPTAVAVRTILICKRR